MSAAARSEPDWNNPPWKTTAASRQLSDVASDDEKGAPMSEPRNGYTTSEIAKLGGLVAHATWRISRGKSTARVDRAIEGVKAAACAREAAQEQARKKAKQDRIDARAAKRAASSWW